MNRAQDIHKQTAAEFFGIPEEEVTDEQRKVGKQINYEKFYSDFSTYQTWFDKLYGANNV